MAVTLTDRAAQLLPPDQTSPPHLAPVAPGVRQSFLVGDKLRIDSIANCPWFVVSQRFWELGARGTILTLWLDEPSE